MNKDIKQFLPFLDKVSMVEQIVDFATSSGDYRPEMKELAYCIMFIKYYTNLPLEKDEDGDEDFIKTYDSYNENNEFNETIYLKIPRKEKNLIDEMVSNRIEKFYKDNSLIGKLIQKIDTLDVKQIIEAINSIDKEKYSEIMKVYSDSNAGAGRTK